MIGGLTIRKLFLNRDGRELRVSLHICPLGICVILGAKFWIGLLLEGLCNCTAENKLKTVD